MLRRIVLQDGIAQLGLVLTSSSTRGIVLRRRALFVDAAILQALEDLASVWVQRRRPMTTPPATSACSLR